MKDPENQNNDSTEIRLNTNEVMHDYEFYLKMYLGDQKMDFEDTASDPRAS